ncbi:hypothetical protein LOC67_14225 [Stieleria sp. JC731]|uniref:hypothetical protein n=1 Tax=Pirellulaceae TaxID=2691357 RepID=UPI001E3B3CB0|nr:hypothetical protein [Stieleria sp. JC731]MCC9601712.1 hypothetical protein [Stieleria sp. JC731]
MNVIDHHSVAYSAPRALVKLGAACLTLVTFSLVGCNESSPKAESGQSRSEASMPELVLSSAPDGDVQTPTEIKDAALESTEVIIAGKIDAGDSDPFQPNQVAFMISQLPDEDHTGGDPDHADNCPFCKRTLANAPKAIIQFRDADGNVLSGDARQALGLMKGDVVVVAGTATFNADIDSVMVDASSLYRKSSAE